MENDTSSSTKSKTCFVIAPIGDEKSSVRRRSNKILKHVIKPVAEECGYPDPVRADWLSTPGMITTQVIEHVVEDDLVIADLTGANPNVFYELAIRHVIRKPLVQLIEKGSKIPFDVAASRTITIDHRDLDSVEQAKKKLRNQIYSAENTPEKIDNPISVTLDLKALNRSEDPEKRSFAEVAEEMAKIGSSLKQLDSRFSALEELSGGSLQEIKTQVEKIHYDVDDALGGSFYALDDIMGKLEELESTIDSRK